MPEESGRRRKYPHSKLIEATAAETVDGRPSLYFYDPLLQRLKTFHMIVRGKIRERPQEPGEQYDRDRDPPG